MAKGLISVILAALAISLSGCGTAAIATCGMAGPVPMYFGVQADVQEGGWAWLDVPFSAMADTVFLPITMTVYGINVCYWLSLDEKQKEEIADECPIPWEWAKLKDKIKPIPPNNGS